MEEKLSLEKKVDKCPECGSNNIIRDYNSGEDVCSKCGLVLGKIYSRDLERRIFDEEQKEKRSRVGDPLTYQIHDLGLTTIIDPLDQDRYRKPLIGEERAKFHRLRKWQERSRIFSALERSLAFGLQQISKARENLTLPKEAVEYASSIFTKVTKKRILRGRSIEGVSAACVYLACRQFRIPRSIYEISEVTGVEEREVGRNYRLICKELGIRVLPPSRFAYTSKLINETEGFGKIGEITYKILLAAEQARLISGKGPAGLSAAALYTASVLTGERRTQEEICKKARCTEVTLRNRYRELMENLLFVVEL